MSNHDTPKQKPKKTDSDSSGSEEDKIDLAHMKALAHKTMKNLCLLDVASYLPGGIKKVKTIVPVNKISDDGSSSSSTNLERQKPIQDMTVITNEERTKDDESASSSEMSSYLDIDDLKGDMMIFYRSLNGESSTFQLSQSLIAVNDLEEPTQTDFPTSSTQTDNVLKSVSTPTSKVHIHTERTTGSNPLLPRTREIGTSTSVLVSEGPENTAERSRVPPLPFIGEMMIGDDIPMRQYLYELTTALYLTAPRPFETAEGPENPDYYPPGPARRNQGTSTSPENIHGDFYG